MPKPGLIMKAKQLAPISEAKLFVQEFDPLPD